MSTATLEGFRVLTARAHLPAWGLPFYDAEIDGDLELAEGARVTLTIADAVFACAVVRGGPRFGRSRYILVGGAGGWSRTLGARAYGVSDLGIPRNHVIEDAAGECGETVEGAPGDVCGPAFVRGEGAASAVLHALAPGAWRVDADGVTRFGAPPETAFVPTTRPRLDLGARSAELAEDSIAALVPGVVIEGLTASDVVHTLVGARLRTTIYGARGGTTERLSLWTALIGALTAELRYAGIFDYRVIYRRGYRIDLQPGLSSGGMPALSAVRVRPGVAGARSEPQIGSLVSVAFLDRSPARPVVCGFDDEGSEFFAPTTTTIDAGEIRLGAQAEHATSAEALAVTLDALCTAIGAAIPGPLAGAGLAAARLAIINAAIPLTAVTSSAPYDPAIAAALAAKTVAGPAIGWPNVRGA